MIEHDLDVIRNSDYIIDMGPEGGQLGGEIIAMGTVEEIKQNKNSKIWKYLWKAVTNTWALQLFFIEKRISEIISDILRVFNFCGGQTLALNIWGSWKQHL